MNIIIVDDQKTVLHSLKNGIHWEKLPIDRLYLASSAKEARAVFAEKTVDVMLTDIEMPGEDGLSLYAWVKERYPEVECIFLTAHADFQYAQKAIQLGGYDYILQPARFEDVEKVIRKACTKILKSRKMKELEEERDFIRDQREILVNSYMERMLVGKEEEIPKLLDKLLSTRTERYEKEVFFLVRAELLHWKNQQESWPAKLLRMTMENICDEMMEELPLKTLVCPIGNSGLFLILYGDGEKVAYETVAERLKKVHDFISEKMDFNMAFYLTRVRERDISRSLSVLEKMQGDNVMKKAQTFVDREERPEEREIPLRDMEQWFQRLENGEGLVVKKEIEEFCQRADRRGALGLKRMKAIHFHFSKAFFAVVESRKVDIRGIFTEEYPYEVFMEAYHTYDGLMEAIDYCLDFLDRKEEEKEDPVEVVIRYIHDNINQNISRKEAANLVYLNEEYFSRLFKARVGLTFKDYVIKERMELAKKLLVSTNFSVGIIVSKVGYDSSSYFSKIFKEMEHMTPLDYRQMHKK